MPLFAKSPYSLPPEHYAGGRKRIFLGLMSASCFLLCCIIGLFLILPWSLPAESVQGLAVMSIALGLGLIILLSWMCCVLVYHIYTGRRLPGIGWVRHVTIRLFFPLMELLAKFIGINRATVRHSFIKVNNEFVLAQHLLVPANKLLLLLPHCIQKSTCPHRLSHTLENCTRCGSCPVGPLLQLRDTYGFSMAIATGGTIARRIVVEQRPRLIIAVACERDLTSGIQDSYPLPVFGILNERPCGPCLDTLVPLRHFENVLRTFILPSPAGIQ